MSHNSFRTCQDVEQRSLEILRPFIELRCHNGQYVIVEKGRLAKELQQSYGDLFFNSANDGGIYTVELKAEETNRWGNLFIEIWSNRSRWNLGWLYKLNADILLYHFLEQDEFHVMSFPELKRWLWDHESGHKPRIYQYAPRVQSKHQQLNDTWGACVPIAHLRSGLATFKTYRASTGERTDNREAA